MSYPIIGISTNKGVLFLFLNIKNNNCRLLWDIPIVFCGYFLYN